MLRDSGRGNYVVVNVAVASRSFDGVLSNLNRLDNHGEFGLLPASGQLAAVAQQRYVLVEVLTATCISGEKKNH